MKRFKVIYHIGEEMGMKTKVDSGFIISENREILLVSKLGETVADLVRINQITLFIMNGLGSMLKVEIENKTIFISVVRFCIAGQFAVGNAIGTRRLKNLLGSNVDINE